MGFVLPQRPDNLCIQETTNLFQRSWHRAGGGKLLLLWVNHYAALPILTWAAAASPEHYHHWNSHVQIECNGHPQRTRYLKAEDELKSSFFLYITFHKWTLKCSVSKLLRKNSSWKNTGTQGRGVMRDLSATASILKDKFYLFSNQTNIFQLSFRKWEHADRQWTQGCLNPDL